MIHSALHSKDTSEDPKTSSVIGSLLLLPDMLVYRILRKACEPHDLPLDNGLISGYEFWPHWFDNTHNSVFVEPDVIISCENRDILIEAKLSDNFGQYEAQWKKEIDAYNNTYERPKKLLFIALGGNDNYLMQHIGEVKIYKCSWVSLLLATISVKVEMELLSYRDEHISQTIRILDLLVDAFSLHGVYTVEPLDADSINQYEIADLSNFFENKSSL